MEYWHYSTYCAIIDGVVSRQDVQLKELRMRTRRRTLVPEGSLSDLTSSSAGIGRLALTPNAQTTPSAANRKLQETDKRQQPKRDRLLGR